MEEGGVIEQREYRCARCSGWGFLDTLPEREITRTYRGPFMPQLARNLKDKVAGANGPEFYVVDREEAEECPDCSGEGYVWVDPEDCIWEEVGWGGMGDVWDRSVALERIGTDDVVTVVAVGPRSDSDIKFKRHQKDYWLWHPQGHKPRQYVTLEERMEWKKPEPAKVEDLVVIDVANPITLLRNRRGRNGPYEPTVHILPDPDLPGAHSVLCTNARRISAELVVTDKAEMERERWRLCSQCMNHARKNNQLRRFVVIALHNQGFTQPVNWHGQRGEWKKEVQWGEEVGLVRVEETPHTTWTPYRSESGVIHLAADIESPLCNAYSSSGYPMEPTDHGVTCPNCLGSARSWGMPGYRDFEGLLWSPEDMQRDDGKAHAAWEFAKGQYDSGQLRKAHEERTAKSERAKVRVKERAKARMCRERAKARDREETRHLRIKASRTAAKRREKLREKFPWLYA